MNKGSSSSAPNKTGFLSTMETVERPQRSPIAFQATETEDEELVEAALLAHGFGGVGRRWVAPLLLEERLEVAVEELHEGGGDVVVHGWRELLHVVPQEVDAGLQVVVHQEDEALLGAGR